MTAGEVGLPVSVFAMAAIAFAGIVLWQIVSVLLRRVADRNRILYGVAKRLGGTLQEATLGREPAVAFTLEGRPARLEFDSGNDENRPTRTRVVVQLDGRSLGTLNIVPDGFFQSFLKIFGAQDIDIGDEDFDRRYVVKAWPESLASRVFAQERRAEAIRSVLRLAGFTHPTIDLQPQVLTIQAREYVIDADRLMMMVRTAQEFLTYLFGTPAVAGIDLGEVRVLQGGECPVCATTLGGGAVRCAACQTSHHRECWTYMGRCSTYACTGKRFVA